MLIKSKPFWNKLGHNVFPYCHYVCEVMGLNPGSSYSKALIDFSITDLIIKLNELGFKTEFCCSGIKKEHGNHQPISAGYILFRDYYRPVITLATKDFNIECKGTIIRLREGLSDKEKSNIWKRFYNNLVKF